MGSTWAAGGAMRRDSCRGSSRWLVVVARGGCDWGDANGARELGKDERGEGGLALVVTVATAVEKNCVEVMKGEVNGREEEWIWERSRPEEKRRLMAGVTGSAKGEEKRVFCCHGSAKFRVAL
ncbi:unnamed protein product [Sphenostylis stenocarpa]|uniref:Uncharacterized protein n=1 Tax=Sphenostylis stenocarpa TaxID=92480 RepID=A0AA86VF54_9FABA|nr:unnamed protein product [Sphenostylis stenocarpa]